MKWGVMSEMKRGGEEKKEEKRREEERRGEGRGEEDRVDKSGDTAYK